MKNLHKYGNRPFSTALIHGGPGAAGEMTPVAKELSRDYGILEPLQTEITTEGQILELKSVLEKYANLPATLVGFSWGAWLSMIFASNFPEMISKLILVSSGPFEQKYAEKIQEKRLSRLSEEQKLEFNSYLNDLGNPQINDKNPLFIKIGKLLSKADAYEPIEFEYKDIDCSYDIFKNVWSQAEELRKSGRLLEYAKDIKCPVVAIHGDYDPHPYKGIEEPLSKYVSDFRFILLKNCGHKPWIEKYAKDKFYNILKREL